MPSKDIYCTYLITYYGDKLPPKFKDSTVTPTKYIGSAPVENINKGYRGSVSSKKYKDIWKQELENKPHLFQLECLSFQNTRKEAFDEEERLQLELDVVKSDEYVNMAIANKKFCSLGPQSEEHKRKRSLAQKGENGSSAVPLSLYGKLFLCKQEAMNFYKCTTYRQLDKIILNEKENLPFDYIRPRKFRGFDSEETKKLKSESAKARIRFTR